MEETTKNEPKKNGFSNGLVKAIELKLERSYQNVTVLDLSRIYNIQGKDEDIKLPPGLKELCLSHNKLTYLPEFVLIQVNLKILDVSHNCINNFDDEPKFCNTLEELNISNNNLKGPPLWIWLSTPRNLEKLDISCNPNIASTPNCDKFLKILDSTTLLTHLNIHHCKLRKSYDLLTTFPKVKMLKIGDEDYNHHYICNNLLEVPCKSLIKCCDIESLNLCNTKLYTVNSDIDIYKNMRHIDLSFNYIHSLPDEFCNLSNLEVCILSCNKLLYLPDNIYKLTKLKKLLLDSNELCMLPINLDQLTNLRILDLYDNNLYEIHYDITNLDEIDFAQNYFEEVQDNEYVIKKQRLRLSRDFRNEGRKLEEKESNDEFSDDDDLSEVSASKECPKSEYDPPSSPEDWDSDDYWIPQYYRTMTPPMSPWAYFVKQKIDEGNFCPIDAHPVSVVEKVKYEKLCNPVEEHESDGQFDDCTDDES
ncbi:malignant fibrous histiocytoma-amplified sequence 1 homolog [Manduca sexta]|uniref:Uncharacterized protein n=1 Tax=Manduca sexta TaxID=7130 RepID=A0A921ZUZ1_MANSE|nr:malignant fibrous histiocytoma-amplified sequence 1 homolog [Manduca sexta]KAG6464185.1 hypothetical protein O3G_MSEX014349 [Manduca sexta]